MGPLDAARRTGVCELLRCSRRVRLDEAAALGCTTRVHWAQPGGGRSAGARTGRANRDQMRHRARRWLDFPLQRPPKLCKHGARELRLSWLLGPNRIPICTILAVRTRLARFRAGPPPPLATRRHYVCLLASGQWPAKAPCALCLLPSRGSLLPSG